jgi:hypothetical protein
MNARISYALVKRFCLNMSPSSQLSGPSVRLGTYCQVRAASRVRWRTDADHTAAQPSCSNCEITVAVMSLITTFPVFALVSRHSRRQ